jgi:gluconate 2-dehydrogenase gamma chain
MKRRKFLITTATVPAATVSCSRPARTWRFLTDGEAGTIAALADQIIPPDQDPGGAEAGVADFIDLQLCGHYRPQRKFYRAGLASLNRTCMKLHGRQFAALSGPEQLSLLQALEKKQVPAELWTDIGPADFFRMVVDHTMQAYYGDPRHGGNKDYASYKLLGISTPPVRGRDQYELVQIGNTSPGGKS